MFDHLFRVQKHLLVTFIGLFSAFFLGQFDSYITM